MTKEKALHLLTMKKLNRKDYEKLLKKEGYPASTTGFYDKMLEGHTCQRIHDLSRNFRNLGFTMFEIFANTSCGSSEKRCKTICRIIGKKKGKFVLNANEVTWKKDNLLEFLNILEKNLYNIKPCCIDIPTRSIDIPQLEQIEDKLMKNDVQISTGEKHYKHYSFYNFLRSDIPHIWQLDIGKMGLNEALLICLMAHLKKGKLIINRNFLIYI